MYSTQNFRLYLTVIVTKLDFNTCYTKDLHHKLWVWFMDPMLHLLTIIPTLLPKSARLLSIWIWTTDISMWQDQQEQTPNRLHLRINEPDQGLPMADQDAPWRLMPWAHAATTVDSLATLPTSVWNQSKRKELALSVERKTIWLRIAQFTKRS